MFTTYKKIVLGKNFFGLAFMHLWLYLCLSLYHYMGIVLACSVHST